MFSKFFQRNTAQQQSPPPQQQPPSQPQQQPQPQPPPPVEVQDNVSKGVLTRKDMNPRIALHYGIPSTASILAFDHIQSLIAIGTLDGRIKVIGGNNIEGLLVSPKQLPFKYLEFLQNQGFLVSVSNENEIQVWDLEQRRIASSLQWESNITAFSVIYCSSYMYIGDEYGMVYVLKYDAEEVKLVPMPYHVPADVAADASGMSSPKNRSVVGVLPQPSSQGNKVLFAYEDGLIILWDISEDKVVLVKGNKDLELKCKIAADSLKDFRPDLSDDISDYEPLEKEIASLCWASTDGSVLAVGYVDGDILLWNLSRTTSKDMHAAKSSNNAVKLVLSTGERRLPVIVLHWSAHRSHDECRGRLFVYGGDAIGSEEVLTILSLDWSSGIESLKCTGRVDLTLNGSFADMVLLPSGGVLGASGTLVLTNPGQLNLYNDAGLSSSISLQEKGNYVSSIQYPMVVPTIEPRLTLAKLGLVFRDGKLSKALSEAISSRKLQATHCPRSTNWPLTGGVPSQLHDAEKYQVERLYIAGYQDGTVKIWDATYPTFALIYVLGPEVKGINVADANGSVSALGFCSDTLSLAIGNERGMVRLYKLVQNADEMILKFVTGTEKEVYTLDQGDGPQCTAVFSFLSSPVHALEFANFGARLAVGFHCAQVALLDTSTSSVLFVTDSLSGSSSPVNSLAVKLFSDSSELINNQEDTESKTTGDHLRLEVFAMTKDAHLVVIDGNTGGIISSQSIKSEKEVISPSMYILEGDDLISEVSSGKHASNSFQKSEAKSEPGPDVACSESTPLKVDHETSAKAAHFKQRVENFLLLFCCEDALNLYSLNEVDSNPIRKVNLMKPCCWSTMFKKDDKECGVILLYQTGEIEIRSLPDLEVVGESSLMSILRWNLKTNMEKTISSSENAQIILVNGCEFAAISLLACENDFRIPESLPCLHDELLASAAAAAATISSSSNQKIEQDASSGILGGLIKGFQGSMAEHDVDLFDVCKNNFAHLESIFSSPPFLKPSIDLMDDQKVVKLCIDDIDIDEPLCVSSSSEMMGKNDTKDRGTERERLFEGASTDSQPELRTADEIKAKYRKEDVSAVAARAKDKLIQRQEKLERLDERTAELQSGAENFASMASELAKQMEKRKWWNV
ncbi:LETHAL 2 GIANT LARVAE PROTEIN [Salix koriyanagi]|uniref:LETHAL 2 GIANT LARVAE PROTEIN n=2 Tax=Salix TaxID=40685 RepID=A0A9Q1AIL0_9ROSI|nr:LETHAL 2 GIANT LARVAE PROTEIN [Salix koriyanagi]